MKPFLIKFLLPVSVATSFFAWLSVYGRGWDAMTYGGADPWSLFFRSIGATSAPTAVALVAAGLTKIFNRDVGFLNTWLAVFLIAFAISAVSSFTVAHHERTGAQGWPSNLPALPDYLFNNLDVVEDAFHRG